MNLEDAFDPTADLIARSAAAELAAWAKRDLLRLRIALERLHPEAAALFPDRAPEGAEVILVVGRLLDRLGKLDRQSEGKPVLTTLAQRGLDRERRRHLATLARAAKHAEPPPAPSGEGVPSAAAANAGLVALHRWYDDWTGTARAIVGRKDWLIRMGLVDRRRQPRA